MQPMAQQLVLSGERADIKDLFSASPEPHLCEGTVIGEDYLRMLLRIIRDHDAEKLALLQRIEDCVKPEQAEVQRLRREMAQRDQKLMQLQQELSENRLVLQEERERANRLLYETTVLYAQADDDRARIASLLQLRHQSMPISSEAAETNASGGADKKKRFTKATLQESRVNAASGLVSERQTPNMSQRRSGSSGTMSLRQAVLGNKSIVAKNELPLEVETALQDALHPPPTSSLVVALKEEVSMLREQLDAQRLMYEHERAKQVQEERERERQHAEEVERYIATVDNLHTLHQSSLSDLIHTRHDMQIELRGLRGTVEKLRVSLDEALKTLEEERQRHSVDLQMVRQRTGENYETVMRRLRQELEVRRAKTISMKEQQGALLAARDAEVERLQQERSKEKQRLQRLEERHRLEVEGVKSEVNLMRQALRAMEKRVYFSQGRCLPL